MAEVVDPGSGGAESLASLERLRQVETNGDAQLRAVRAEIDRALSQLRGEGEAQVRAAKERAEDEAAVQLDQARKDADSEAARIMAEVRANLAEKSRAGAPDLSHVWTDLLVVLFGEFR